MIRFFDLLFSILGLTIFFPVFTILLIIGFFDTGSPIFRQERIGINQKKFWLYKFRSMHLNTENVATHLVTISSITKWGRFLRKSKMDELPQLINVLKGDMSFVGPRPNLINQFDLIKERNKRGVYNCRPGITGLSQIKEIDMSTPALLAETDAKMIDNLTVFKYLMFILVTFSGKGFGDRIKV